MVCDRPLEHLVHTCTVRATSHPFEKRIPEYRNTCKNHACTRICFSRLWGSCWLTTIELWALSMLNGSYQAKALLDLRSHRWFSNWCLALLKRSCLNGWRYQHWFVALPKHYSLPSGIQEPCPGGTCYTLSVAGQVGTWPKPSRWDLPRTKYQAFTEILLYILLTHHLSWESFFAWYWYCPQTHQAKPPAQNRGPTLPLRPVHEATAPARLW